MMDSWREELERSIVRGLEDSDDKFEVQLMEDIFLHLRSRVWSRGGQEAHVASQDESMCTGIGSMPRMPCEGLF
jgi:hypothetical protein